MHPDRLCRAIGQAFTAAAATLGVDLRHLHAATHHGVTDRFHITGFAAGMADHTVLRQTGITNHGDDWPRPGGAIHQERRAWTLADTLAAEIAVMRTDIAPEHRFRISTATDGQQARGAVFDTGVTARTSSQKGSFRNCPGRTQRISLTAGRGCKKLASRMLHGVCS